MRQYLLGTLPEEQALAIEERYFKDRFFFNEIRGAEIKLICDYLDGALDAGEQAQFEIRYMLAPRLKTLVEEVRKRRAAAVRQTQTRHRMFVAALATAAVICTTLINFPVLREQTQAPQPVAINTPPPGVTLFLEPGVTKGAGSQMNELVLPAFVQSVSLVAELPGQSSSTGYVARIFNIDRGGDLRNIFISGQIRSVSRNGGQQITVGVPSSGLAPGDYILDVRMQNGPVQEKYVFRVKAPLP